MKCRTLCPVFFFKQKSFNPYFCNEIYFNDTDMNVNDELIDKLSKLAKLDFTTAESKAEIKADLDSLLERYLASNKLSHGQKAT